MGLVEKERRDGGMVRGGSSAWEREAFLEAVRGYLGRGWAPIPLPYRKKGPVIKGWQSLRLTKECLDRYFHARRQNVGILLGEPSGGLVDVDLDCPEARELADRFLDPTPCVFGREGSRRSHRLYRMEPAAGTTKFEDPEGRMLLEVRSTGVQTVFPPSVHVSGEAIEWEECGDLPLITESTLLDRAARLAAACILARRWPKAGSRQEAALALAGGLLRGGWEESAAEGFLKAVARAAKDEEAGKRTEAAAYTADRLRRGETVTGWPRLAEMIGDGAVKRLLSWLKMDDSGTVGAQGDGGDGRFPFHSDALPVQEDPEDAPRTPLSHSRMLMELAGTASFFHTPDRNPYAILPVGEHREVWPLRSREVKLWLQHRFYAIEGRPAGSQAIQDTIGTLEARAQFDSPCEAVYTRVAWTEGALYLDLGNDAWEAVEVTASGWRAISDPPVRFRRSRGMAPLPVPVAGGLLEELREFINAPEESLWRLMASWLVGTLLPGGPYPILVVQGEQGSAKSTTVRVLRALVDPSALPLRSGPKDERDLAISAHNCWVLAYDNLSGIAPWFSDALCRLSTGGGFATRELYTDDGETIFYALRPAILNGIDDLTARDDLADRSLIAVLPPIPEERRKCEQELWERFTEAHPLLLGVLLDAASAALRNRRRVVLPSTPRMADFTRWVVAAEESLPWEPGGFLEAYEENRKDTIAISLEADPVAVAVRALLSGRGDWVDGTYSELLTALTSCVPESLARSSAWPKSPRGISGRLRRVSTNLRSSGISVAISREPHTRRRLVTIRMEGETTVPTVPTVPIVPEIDEATDGPRKVIET